MLIISGVALDLSPKEQDQPSPQQKIHEIYIQPETEPGQGKPRESHRVKILPNLSKYIKREI